MQWKRPKYGFGSVHLCVTALKFSSDSYDYSGSTVCSAEQVVLSKALKIEDCLSKHLNQQDWAPQKRAL